MIYPRINIVHRMFDNKLKVEANLNGYQRKYDIGYSNDVYQSALILIRQVLLKMKMVTGPK